MKLGAAAVAVLGPTRLARAAEFYAGKTIEIIVPFTDWCRCSRRFPD
jgi:hypothetical protein